MTRRSKQVLLNVFEHWQLETLVQVGLGNSDLAGRAARNAVRNARLLGWLK